jgi:transposase
MEQTTRFVGLDIHKATIVAAVISAGERGKAAILGTFPNTRSSLEKLVGRLRAAGNGTLKFCYEAGPCGYGVHRALTGLGEDCVIVVAPSMIPRRPGDRQKTDKRDAASLAMLHKAGLLTAVWVPDPAHEAIRDLIRARLAAVRAVRTTRQQLSAFLLRHERVFPDGRTPWTRAHRRWLAEQRFDQPAQQIVLEECIEAVRLAEQRRERVEAHLRAQIPDWSLAPLVRDLCALRGLDVIGSAGLAAAIGDATRFPSAGDFMGYLGMVPSEHSSGPRQRLGAITKSGDVHARTILIEAAWSYRFPARIARAKLAAVEAVPDAVREIAWKAQVRLCRRYRRMMERGKPKQVVVTAIARELAGFVWAIACHHMTAAATAPVREERRTDDLAGGAGAERSRPVKATPLRAGPTRQRTKRVVVVTEQVDGRMGRSRQPKG